VGVAYQLNEKTVVRGGYGLYYFPQAEFGGTTGFTISTPFVATSGGGAQAFIPLNTLSNPFPNGINRPTGSAQGLLTQAGGNLIFSNVEREIPKIHQFSVGLQRTLPGEVRFDIAYVGSRSRDILTNDFNVGNARTSTFCQPNNLPQPERIPPSSMQTCRILSRVCCRAPASTGLMFSADNCSFRIRSSAQVTQALENIGEVDYDSLQVSAEKRMRNGLTMIASYTFSKTLGALGFLNPQDAQPDRSVTDFDRPHVLVVSGVYQLPFGQGQRFGGDIGKGLNMLIGGWEYNFIARFQSGLGLNLPGNVDLIGDPRIDPDSRTFDRYFNTCVRQANGTSRQPNAARNGFEPCTNPVWAVRGADTLRTTPFRTARIREHTVPQFDMSLNKSFNFSERYRAQFRAEAFNVANSPLFGAPNNDPNSTNFGFVTRGQRNFPRQVQLGFKFYF
jgi:hypothetical protein